MDPTEITKHLPEIAKATTAVAASIPFTAIVKRMLGPAADELAEMWRDQVRLYRYERQLKCVEKAEKMAENAGFTPQAVPPKILFPLLEGASFEEDENLHDMWAALLANAASPDNAEKVRPGYIYLLRQIAPDEAALLHWICDYTSAESTVSSDDYWSAAQEAVPSFVGEDNHAKRIRLRTCCNNLEAVCLIERAGFRRVSTSRGYEFFTACQPPKPKS